ncbi:sensor histidine kinase [Kribbella sp. CA-293567]|uniref:sensor histidine kinase n=1 Tax=Kribbella sp. CA-293567 TaxID=3002436 RepID=UPI0022DD1A3B|nr:histidine kinase [Kribbella sp. CA-293567]WBQ02960.1 histidine kinase [Kribbella sp. CA-293567]
MEWARSSVRRMDPWVVSGVLTAAVTLMVGGVSAVVGEDAGAAGLWIALGLGVVGLALSTRASIVTAVVAALLAAQTVRDPAPWGSWAVAGALLFLFALRRPRFDAVAAGIAFAGAVMAATFLTGLDGGNGGTFGLIALAVAMVGVGQWVQAQRRYVIAEIGRRRQETERRREEVARHVAEERLRIARELHDSVAHHLAVVSVHTNVARANLLRSPQVAERALDDVQVATQSVLEELQIVLNVLRASESELVPSTPVGADLVEDLLLSFEGIGLRVETNGLEQLSTLAPVARTAAQRLLQEALTNAQRYGDGSAEVIASAPVNGYVTLSIRNTRAAQGTATAGGSGLGLGLVGMEERVHLLGGTFRAGPEADGFLVTAQLPATAPRPTKEPLG